ncbi:MarR family winged helix-turn-helix transcriptional regulator [Streptomyces sp. NPDC088400]|uniref:MarR family winged helix-turn-helix transcriptional regulator n=1 Tax=Streptomyces sp. NPDC088400 TaxID=3365861 RepID=UPI0037F993E0
MTLPRALDEDLLRSTGLSLTQYTVLMCLSEIPHNSMRMTELASATALSASRVTRVVESMQARGLLSKRRHSTDARGNVVTITEAGRDRLRTAYPTHLASARARVLDYLDRTTVGDIAVQLQAVAEPLCPTAQTPGVST